MIVATYSKEASVVAWPGTAVGVEKGVFSQRFRKLELRVDGHIIATSASEVITHTQRPNRCLIRNAEADR